MNKIESMYTNTLSWMTETPLYSKRNYNFYVNKCGFKNIKVINHKDLTKGLYIFKNEI